MKQNDFAYRKHVSKIVKEVEHIDKAAKRNNAYRKAGLPTANAIDILEAGSIFHAVKKMFDEKKALER